MASPASFLPFEDCKKSGLWRQQGFINVQKKKQKKNNLLWFVSIYLEH